MSDADCDTGNHHDGAPETVEVELTVESAAALYDLFNYCDLTEQTDTVNDRVERAESAAQSINSAVKRRDR